MLMAACLSVPSQLVFISSGWTGFLFVISSGSLVFCLLTFAHLCGLASLESVGGTHLWFCGVGAFCSSSALQAASLLHCAVSCGKEGRKLCCLVCVTAWLSEWGLLEAAGGPWCVQV